VDLYNAARKADAARAQVLQEKLMGASKLVATLGAAGVKYAMQLLGYYGGPARRPLLPLTESEQDEVRRVTESLAGSQAIARS
jgi:4-hydroxy-2-oxoglutarate aldolase